MTINSNQRIVNGRELIAFIREAYAFRDPINILFNSVSIPVEITNFDDGDAREINSVRTLSLLIPKPLNYLILPNNSIDIEVTSKRFKLSFSTKIIAHSEQTITIQLAKEASICNVRKSERLIIKDQGIYDGIIIGKQKIASCLIQFLDLSTGSFGAKIFTNVDLEALEGPLYLNSDIQNEQIFFRGPAKLIQYRSTNKGGSEYEYIVALECRENQTNGDHTRAERHKLPTALHCKLPTSNTKVSFEIADISATGFLVIKSTPKIPWVTVGLTVVEQTTNLTFAIMRIESNGNIGFKLQSSSPEEKIKWINFVLPLISSGKITTNVHDPRSLINIFLEAGGTLANNLGHKRHSATHADTLSVLTNQSDILLRWVNISESGNVLGHHSTYRIGLNSWCTGDIVGGQTAEKKIDTDFIRSNFQLLKELLSSLNEPQIIMGSFKFGHPYWKKFINSLIADKNILFLETYDHISRESLDSTIATIDYENHIPTNLSAKGHEYIFEELYNLSKTSFRKLLAALDITCEGFFFKGTESIYSGANLKGFRREVFKFLYKNEPIIAIYSQLPPGVSLNGVFDTAFIIPINDNLHLELKEKHELYNIIKTFGLSCGYKLYSLRSFIHTEEFIGTKSEFVTFTPNGLEYFSK
jgi:hypothetical protein